MLVVLRTDPRWALQNRSPRVRSGRAQGHQGTDSVKVAVRVRPFSQREIESNAKLCVEMDGNITTVVGEWLPPRFLSLDAVAARMLCRFRGHYVARTGVSSNLSTEPLVRQTADDGWVVLLRR